MIATKYFIYIFLIFFIFIFLFFSIRFLIRFFRRFYQKYFFEQIWIKAAKETQQVCYIYLRSTNAAANPAEFTLLVKKLFEYNKRYLTILDVSQLITKQSWVPLIDRANLVLDFKNDKFVWSSIDVFHADSVEANLYRAVWTLTAISSKIHDHHQDVLNEWPIIFKWIKMYSSKLREKIEDSEWFRKL